MSTQRSLEDANLSNHHQLKQLQQQMTDLQGYIETLTNPCSNSVEIQKIRAQTDLILDGLYRIETALFQSPWKSLETQSLRAANTQLIPLDATHQWPQFLANQTLKVPAPECIIRMSRTGIFLDFKQIGNISSFAPTPVVKGSSIYDLLPNTFAYQCLESIEQTLTLGEATAFDFQVEKNNIFYCKETYIFPIQSDEVLVVVWDVSDRSPVESAPLKSDATNSALSLSSIHDPADTQMQVDSIQFASTELKRSQEETDNGPIQEREFGALKSHFIAITSHEFRTPLTVILSSASLLENYSDRWNDEKKLIHLQRIQRAGQRIAQLLDDILVLHQAEANKLQYQPVPMDLPQFCRALVVDLRLSDNDQHQIQFSCVDQSATVWMDEQILQQILNNLLSNAVKYSPAGSIINFTLSYDQDLVIFQVQDHGIGIPSNDLPHIFESFHRGNNVGTISGTGLGLAIAKKCVDRQNGTIAVTSQKDVGTLVIVKLPVGQSRPNHDKDLSN